MTLPSTAELTKAVEDLTKTLERIQAKRDAEIDQIQQRYALQIAQLEQAIAALNGVPSNGNQAAERRLYISDEKLATIEQYCRERGTVRQADIASDLGLNTGTASNGTRRLQAEGKLRSGPVQDGSRQWEWIGDPATSSEGAIVLAKPTAA